MASNISSSSSKTDKALKISNYITQSAQSKSQKACAKYVRIAIQNGLDKPLVGAGIESAKDFGPWLIKNSYTPIDKSYEYAKVGDVVVFQDSQGHPHGHIQIYCADGKWRSDFVQNGFSPYKDGSIPKFTIYEINN